MDGCDDPIIAPWRQEAEDRIYKAVSVVGGKVLDVTWFLTSLVVTLDEDVMPPKDYFKTRGPVIEVEEPGDPIFYDPEDPNPDDIWADEDEVAYQRETEEEIAERKQRERNMYASKDKDDPEDESHIPYEGVHEEITTRMNEETRADLALGETEDVQQAFDEAEKDINLDTLDLDKAALSTIAQAILDALEDVEDDLRILQRHELVLAGTGASDVLETQKQFDAYRDMDVIVETQDPWESNRVLKGKLIDRNSMDVMINKKGRMVTIPNNFVRFVRVPVKEYQEEDLAP